MSIMVLTAAYLAIAGTTYFDKCNKIELAVDVEEKDMTTYASLGWKEVLGGIKSGQLAIGFLQDVDTGELDDDLWPLVGTKPTFEVRLKQDAVGTSNPKYTGNFLLKEWKPIMGSVGDVSALDVTWPTSGVVTRATA